MSFTLSWRALAPGTGGAAILVGLALAASAFPSSAPPERPDGPAFKTVHVFNLSPADAEQLAGVMREYNALFVRLGHPASRYRLWRLEGDASGRPAYIWESEWPSRAVYDQVHAEPAFQELLRSTFPRLSQLLKDHQYGQYGEIEIGRPTP